MLDDQDGVALVDEALDDQHQFADVLEVQTGGRLVEDVDRPAVGPLLQLTGQLHALCLTAGQCRRRLTEPHVPQPDIDQRVEVAGDRGDRAEEFRGLADRHVEDLGDRLPLVVDLQGLPVVPGTLADLAGDVDVRQEVHLDLQRAVTVAGLAASALDVETEPAGLVATDLGLGGLGEEVADLVEDAGVRRRVRARRPADRALVHPDQLVQLVKPGDLTVVTGHLTGAVELVRQHLGQDPVDEAGLA